ncbi:MAG: hypothetical protein GY830_00555 [Bacteroidetes bacterium]|nr:hypothetical protein [Bacteroidota bacterium]
MTIQEIKQRLSIEEVLNHYGLKPNKNKMLNCPFHEDKTPSMQIYEESNTVYCFSSNLLSVVFRLLIKYFNICKDI